MLLAQARAQRSGMRDSACLQSRRVVHRANCIHRPTQGTSPIGLAPLHAYHPPQADSFQSDIFPPAPSSEPSLTAGEFFSGKTPALKLVSLDTGVVSTTASSAGSVPGPAPTKTASAPEPAPAPQPQQPVARKSEPEPTPITPSAPSPATPAVASPMEYKSAPAESSGGASTAEIKALKEENAALHNELREAREKIRNLELQVEGIRANARKAAEALLQG